MNSRPLPRLLVISHSSIIPGYRYILKSLADIGNFQISLVAPEKWIEANVNQPFIADDSIDSALDIHVENVATWALRKRSLRNVTHLYPGTVGLLRRIRPRLLYIVEEPFSFVTASWILGAHLAGLKPGIAFFSGQSIYKRYPPPFSWCEKFVLARAHMAFPVNQDVAGVLERKGFFSSRVLPLGYDPRLFRPLAEIPRPGPEKAGFTVGFVGALTEQKGLPIALKAFREAGARSARLDFLVVGTGPLKQAVVDEFDGPLSGRATFPGFVPHSDMPEVLREIDLLVVPSVDMPNVREQLGRVIIEAMACGIPVIGSRCGEIGRVIDDPDMVVPQGDHLALAERILALANDGQAYRSKVSKVMARAKLFSWDTVARGLDSHLRDLMGISEP